MAKIDQKIAETLNPSQRVDAKQIVARLCGTTSFRITKISSPGEFGKRYVYYQFQENGETLTRVSTVFIN